MDLSGMAPILCNTFCHQLAIRWDDFIKYTSSGKYFYKRLKDDYIIGEFYITRFFVQMLNNWYN